MKNEYNFSIDKGTTNMKENKNITTAYVQGTTILNLYADDNIQLQQYQDSGSTLTALADFVYLAVVKLYDL